MYQNHNESPKVRNVVIYARVSTEHEAQLSALENQKDWYKPIVEQYPEWNIIRMYVDEGITGTSAKKRPQFMKMIEDAEYGEFDLILTREVSRFARNTVDTLQYTRDLKAKGVEVFFINDNIKTFDSDGELRLTIMATLAQDESRKTSIRVKSGQQTSMENGVFYGNGNILGYDRIEQIIDGKKQVDFIINPEQANTVRRIFDLYLSGIGIRAIKFKLEQAGRLTATGKTNWHESNISKILQNSFYCGIITYHKEFTPDYLEQKKIRNFGDMEYTRVRGRHEPIITEEEYKQVQKMIGGRRMTQPNVVSGRRKPLGKRRSCDVWTDLLVCECGHKFNRKIWHKQKDKIQYGYQCYSSIRTGTITTRENKGLPTDGVCKTPMIAGWKLQLMAKHIFKEYLHNAVEVLTLAQTIIDNHIDDKQINKDNTKLVKQKEAELDKLNKRLNNLIEMRADGEITKETFKNKKEEIETRIDNIKNELIALEPKEFQPEEASHDEKIEILKFYMEQSINPDTMENLSDEVIKAFVKKIVVKEDRFEWYLRFSPDNSPTSLNVNGHRKSNATISSLCLQQHRQLLTKVGNSNFVKVQEISIKLSDAKAYLYSSSTRCRVHKWLDLNISVFI